MKTVKAKSSKYINHHKPTPQRFEWQEGYEVFLYGQSQIDKVYHYIQNQEVHHKKQTFREEYLEFLKNSLQRIKTLCYKMFRAYGSIKFRQNNFIVTPIKIKL